MLNGWFPSLRRRCPPLRRSSTSVRRTRWWSLEVAGLVERVVEHPGRPATCWPFIIPKSSEKVSVIFHLVDFNDTMPRPARFSLCSWENMADRLSAWTPREPLYCTHIDLKNAFWSFVLPPKAARAFRFGFRPGGGGTGHVPHATHAVWVEVFPATMSIGLAKGNRGDSPTAYDHFPLLG